ncbi:MAG: hypothetical protein QXF79_02790 [Ignisphaera sp.]
MDLCMNLDSTKDRLDDLELVREELIKHGRDIINLSRNIVTKIVLSEDAEELVENLKQQFNKLRNSVDQYPELLYTNMFYSIAAEYVEAIQLYYITRERRILPPEEINVHPIPYLLGLIEVIGELKRLSLELIRRNRFDDAYNLLEVAENLYNCLTSFSYPDALLPGFRRKLDIYRKVIDDWKKFLIDMESRRRLIQKLSIIIENTRVD